MQNIADIKKGYIPLTQERWCLKPASAKKEEGSIFDLLTETEDLSRKGIMVSRQNKGNRWAPTR